MKKNVFSRTLAVLASTAVLGAASMISANAAGEAASIDNVTAAPGETVAVNVVASSGDQLTAFNFVLAYDTALTVSGDPTFAASGSSGSAEGLVSLVGYTDKTMADGAVATVNFTVPEDAKDGQVYEITFSAVNEFSLASGDDVAANVEGTPGSIKVVVPEEETTAAATEAATTAATTTAAKKTTGSPKTGAKGVAVAVAGLVTAGAAAVVLKKRH